MTRTDKIYVKRIKTTKGSFNKASYLAPNGKYFAVKFTRTSGIDINKLQAGYYYVTYDKSYANITTQEYTKKDGTSDIQYLLWIDGKGVEITPHVLTKEEIEARGKRFDNLLDGID